MLVYEFQGRASGDVDAPPDDVFAAITDIDRLPQWNARVAAVLEPPPESSLPEGSEWVVQMHVPPAQWRSRARVVVCDRDRRCFEHVSSSDDGNPSFVVWRWTVAPNGGGSTVTVVWDVQVRSFWRRLLFARLRRRQLAGEVPASLAALAYHLAPHEAPA